MSNVGNDIERLMVRRLDGENDEEQELRLNRELIRNPDARRLMNEYQRAEDLAAEVLRATFAGSEPTFDPMALPDRTMRGPARTTHRIWWMWSGAVAAALLAIVLARAPWGFTVKPNVPGAEPLTPLVHNQSPRWPGSANDSLQWTVGTQRPGMTSIKRHTGREIFGVVADDGNVYWIEVDRTRTIKRLGSGWESRFPPV